MSVESWAQAIKTGNLSELQALIRNDRYRISWGDAAELTPLHMAAREGSAPMIEALLEGGALIDAQSRSGMTPLMAACSGGFDQAARSLLRAGARVELTNALGLTALHWAAPMGDASLIRALIDAGASASAREGGGKTPLMSALETASAPEKKLRSFRALLEATEDERLDQRDREGKTALRWAVENDHEQALQDLIDRGADLNPKDHQGITPLMSAALKARSHLVIRLLRAGADATLRDHFGRDALRRSVMRNDLLSGAELLRAGADLHAPDRDGVTSAQQAAERELPEWAALGEAEQLRKLSLASRAETAGSAAPKLRL